MTSTFTIGYSQRVKFFLYVTKNIYGNIWIVSPKFLDIAQLCRVCYTGRIFMLWRWGRTWKSYYHMCVIERERLTRTIQRTSYRLYCLHQWWISFKTIWRGVQMKLDATGDWYLVATSSKLMTLSCIYPLPSWVNFVIDSRICLLYTSRCV